MDEGFNYIRTLSWKQKRSKKRVLADENSDNRYEDIPTGLVYYLPYIGLQSGNFPVVNAL